MHYAQSPDEWRHLAESARRLRPHTRVRVLYPDYVSLEGTVTATHAHSRVRGSQADSLSFTIRVDGERELEVDVFDVYAIHPLDS